MRHILHSIDKLFQPKNPLDVKREDPILPKNLTRWGAKRITKNIVLVLAIDTNWIFLTLTQVQKDNLMEELVEAPPKATQVSKKNLFCLLAMMRSAVPEIA